ncbi:MAG TPA: emopamil-binding family protein [Ktedonobacteraceae bacterium]
MRQTIPLSRRPADIFILIFFLVNLLFITYIVDLEQLVIPNAAHFVYPVWPPAPAVDIIHNWGNRFDPLLIARPAWWKMTLWIDALFFGPFYVAALFAYIKGKEWIRIPSIIYSSVMLTNVTIILGDEYAGAHAAPSFTFVFFENLPWLLFPLFILYRMWRYEHPFTRAVSLAEEPAKVETSESGPSGSIETVGGA